MISNLKEHGLNLDVPVELHVLPELVQQVLNPLHKAVTIQCIFLKQKLFKKESESLLQSEKASNKSCQ